MPSSRGSVVTRAFAATALWLAAATLSAQQGGGLTPELASIPVEQEPRHRVVFANEFVRIIDANLPALYVSERHTHAADNVAVIVQADRQGQGRIGFASFARGGYSHVITNPATTPMRFIDVELRSSDRGESADPSDLPGHEVVLSTARERVSRVTIDAGSELTDHQHANGYATIVVRGREGAGTWKWHPSGEAAATLAAGPQTLEIVEVEPR